MSIVEKLTEGIVNRDLGKEGDALITKWQRTGLLEGVGSDHLRNGMARLLENQAKELLRESSTMASGDVEGFAAVAFPLVRRVFGNLIANDLVSVQPMSLPSGLIFFLDFVVGNTVADGVTATQRLGYPTASSFYGGNVVGSQITGGVNLSGKWAEQGPYGLNNGYSSPTGSSALPLTLVASGTFGTGASFLDRACGFDPDLVSGSTRAAVYSIPVVDLSNSVGNTLNLDDLVALNFTRGPGAVGLGAQAQTTEVSGTHIRRLTQYSASSNDGPLGDRASTNILVVFKPTTNTNLGLGILTQSIASPKVGYAPAGNSGKLTASFTIDDDFANGGALGSVIGSPEWGLENAKDIPEIDIKIDSVAVTAITKKLKAKWTPELGQDLNAYHNLDAEVELTQILSEQIALEIDREIMEDLVRGATAAVRYWSRNPGQFVNRERGGPITPQNFPPDFTGNVSEWYETLIETVNDVSAQIHRKTLRGGANFIVCGPEVANILEFTAGFRANVTADSERGDAGAVKVGSLSKKFDIFVDPYFVRNLILVGRRGSSFLESGYVYAPYVPLQTTPTIFGVEDFVPRKGVMTRYAKKMVRPDMYGLVVVENLI